MATSPSSITAVIDNDSGQLLIANANGARLGSLSIGIGASQLAADIENSAV